MDSPCTIPAAPATGYAVYVYDHGEEIFLVRVRPPREWSLPARLLGRSAFCVFFAYVYYLIFTK